MSEDFNNSGSCVLLMDLSILVNARKAEAHPLAIFVVGVIYSFVAVLLSKWIFPGYESIAMLALTTAAAVPFVFQILNYEEHSDKRIRKEKLLLAHHKRALVVFAFLFFGFVLGYITGFFSVPAEENQVLFEAQLLTLMHINKNPTAGYSYVEDFSFATILLNNLRVLGFILLFSLIFGAGGIVILAWNASVIAAALGTFIAARVFAFAPLNVFSVVSQGFFRYLVHGVPEIIAYLIASLAGGIIYIAILRKEVNRHLMIDAALLAGISVLFLVVAALLEVGFAPAFY